MKTETLNPTKQANKVKNTTKLAQTKSINLLTEAKKQTNKLKQGDKANFKTVVIGSNNILKEECFKLGYAIKLLLSSEEIIINAQKQKDNFTQSDYKRLLDIFSVINQANKSTTLYKKLETLKGIKTKSGKFVPFFLLRTVNSNIDALLKLIK
jgi:hypothetical protein